MAPSKAFKCGQCLAAIRNCQVGIQCWKCKKWFSAAAANLSGTDLKLLYETPNIVFICPSCNAGLDDIKDAIRKFEIEFDEILKKNKESLEKALSDAVADIQMKMRDCFNTVKSNDSNM